MDSLTVIWSSPLSDYNRVLATSQFALPALTYFMWTQVCTTTDLQRLNRETRKVMVVHGAKHPLSSTDLLYLPRKIGGRGLKSIEREYKTIKIKAAMNLYSNNDPAIHLVRQFEEKAARTGSRSLIKDAESYAKQLGLRLELQYPQPVGVTEAGNVIDRKKFSGWSKKVNQSRGCAEIESERWQGKLIAERWRDEDVDEECFAWMSDWKTAPIKTVAGLQELYQQLLPTKLYASRKTKTHTGDDEKCRLCRKARECRTHGVRLQYTGANLVPD